jgi:hypothetical protein
MKTFRTALLGITLLLAGNLSAQDDMAPFHIPTTNPEAMVQQYLASTRIEIKYHRPSVRDRVIFGGLVPYDKVWRTGSDAATTVSFSTPVEIEGARVEAGAYELFTIPGKEYWTVILQNAQSQWGSYSYDPSDDAARVDVKPVVLDASVESFTISVDDIKPNTAIINITWDRVRVPVRITIDLEETVIPQLEAALSAEGRRPYFLAAMFYYENDLDIDRAAELMTLAVAERPKHMGMLYRLALILERKGDISGAINAAERSLAEAKAADAGELQDEYIGLNAVLLERLK